ncbi:MAG: hypothetical protein DLM58_18225 [Pseudonocardiales bacterium]|nr:MAG: hypothetical protein DLM58_18225 [Pseudonocardiales bacterium]
MTQQFGRAEMRLALAARVRVLGMPYLLAVVVDNARAFGQEVLTMVAEQAHGSRGPIQLRCG